MKKLIIYSLLLLLLPVTIKAQVTVTGSAGADGNYTSLTVATGAFARINANVQTGRNIIITITGNSTSETGATVLGAGLWTSLVIYPVSTGLTISGSNNNPLIAFNGSDNVTIDGRVNRVGSAADLTINNTNTGNGASTIRLYNSAENNTIQYCNLRGSGANTARGVIFFSNSASGNGNDGNHIEYNNITGNVATRPKNGILSVGTAALANSGNYVVNNNIFDNLDRTIASNGIFISTGNSDWTVTGNSFYETTPLIPAGSVAYYAIRINSTAGSNYNISDNFIGGSSPSCGGAAFTKTNATNNIFYGIYFNASTTAASSIQNNSIRNFDWSNSANAAWYAMQIAGGTVNVGTVTGNTIGAATGTGSILVTGTTTGNTVYGIYLTGTGTIDCRNNTVGSVTAANGPANASNIYGISKSATAGTTTISNNLIGSAATPNSIHASSGSTGNSQNVLGIYNAGTGTIIISGNTIANLTDGSVNNATGTTGEINGISSISGINTISGNIIHDLTNGNAYSATNQNSSVCGISLSGATQKTVTGNTIYNLSNTFTSFTGSVIGIYFTGSTTANAVSENFIHSLSVTSGSATADIYGILMASGTTIYSNNIISLASNSLAIIYGIYETGATGTGNNLYFNTVYIGGTPASGTNRSYALYSALAVNTRNFRNNVLVNARSTSGGSNLHYALYIVTAGGTLTCNYNDYFVSGTGGTLGYYGANRTTLPIVTGQDANSLAVNPALTNAGGTAATDYKTGAPLTGVTGTGITTDFGGFTRTIPSMGAWEGVINMWKGSLSSNWNTPGNWTAGVVPGTDANIIFDQSPSNHCQLDQNRSVTDITNSQAVYRLVTNGNQLIIKGAINFTNGATIDASAVNSTVEFAGTTAQSVPSGSFYNNRVYNLTVNNPVNVTLYGTINLLNTLTATSGRLDAVTGTPVVIYGGSGAQTIENNLYLNNTIYNLTSDNTAGVTLNTDFTVSNILTINSGRIFTVHASRTLTVNSITNNAGSTGLIIKSDAAGDARLINNSSAAAATVELYLNGDLVSPGVGRFHYFVPPVQTMSIGTVPTIAETRTALGLTYFNGDLLAFNEPAAVSSQAQGWQYFDNYPGTPPGFTSLVSSRGYNIYLNGPNDVVKFNGQLNAGQHTFSLSYTTGNVGAGWNLVGNPYPCNYDLNGIDGLGTIVTGISNTVYYTSEGAYGYWNVYTNTGSSGSYSDILPPMTGFFVRVSQAGMSLTLPVSSKTSLASDSRSLHKGAAVSAAKGGIAVKKVKLRLTSSSQTDETIAMLFDDATNSYNEHYDAFKLFGSSTSVPNIYIPMNGVDYFMKAVAGPVSSPVIVPLKVVIREAGTHTINISEFENMGALKVVLKHGAKETPLALNTSYTFTSGAGTFTDFELIIGDITTAVETPLTRQFSGWYSNSFAYFNLPGENESGNGILIIYDFNGRQVLKNSNVAIVSGQTIQVPAGLEKGFYVMDLQYRGMHHKTKIVVY